MDGMTQSFIVVDLSAVLDKPLMHVGNQKNVNRIRKCICCCLVLLRFHQCSSHVHQLTPPCPDMYPISMFVLIFSENFVVYEPIVIPRLSIGGTSCLWGGFTCRLHLMMGIDQSGVVMSTLLSHCRRL